jgi:predicted PurR-regulated permease PerM
MLLQSREIKETCLLLFKDEHKNEARIILEQLSTQLGAYVRGQLLVALTVGIMVWLGLQFIKVPYAPLLGLLASVFDVVPILGSIAASVLGIIVALANDPALAFWTLVVYLVANQIEQNFLSPLILGKAVGISTFWVLISIFFGSVLYGLAGLYLGIPVAVIIKIAFEHFYKKDGKSRQLAAGSI